MVRYGLRRAMFGLVGALVVASLLAVPTGAQADPLATPLVGGTNPAEWDVDGRGWLEVSLRGERLCYTYQVSNVSPVVNVRIMERATWREVVVLQRGAAPAACVTLGKEVAKALQRNPAAYAVVLGTSQYPSGALRANLALAMGIEQVGGNPDQRPPGWANAAWNDKGNELPPGHSKPGESDADHDNGYGNDKKESNGKGNKGNK